jgi:hypothetical protein
LRLCVFEVCGWTLEAISDQSHEPIVYARSVKARCAVCGRDRVSHGGAPCVAPRASWHAHTRLSSPSCLWSSASRTGALFTRRPRGRAQHGTRQGWHTCTHSACLQISSKTGQRPHLTTSGHRSGRHHAERTISHHGCLLHTPYTHLAIRAEQLRVHHEC